LLDKNYLSLAEVQVMGVDLLRFAKVDYSSAQNDIAFVNRYTKCTCASPA
jgi:hypothetical protein